MYCGVRLSARDHADEEIVTGRVALADLSLSRSSSARLNSFMPAKFTVEECRKSRLHLQDATREAFAQHQNAARAGTVDHHGFVQGFGDYQLYLSVQGQSWIRIDNKEWTVELHDISRFVADGRRRNSRFMTRLWGAVQPKVSGKSVPVRPGYRAYVVAQDGTHRAKDIYRNPDNETGTRQELSLGYLCRRAGNKNRKLLRRVELLMELCPLAGRALILERARSGYVPTQKPFGMNANRFKAICIELRDGKPRAKRKYVFHGRQKWESKLPPPAVSSTI
jgi:hypothetical protein